ncbi:MAG: aldo/keto reductase [Verrucomicrobia bacterium]|nr:aldo/keto reductase [Verrucomicrobiota bacterium]
MNDPKGSAGGPPAPEDRIPNQAGIPDPEQASRLRYAINPTRRETTMPSLVLERRDLRDDGVAFGLAGIGGAWGPVDPGVARETMQRAMEIGIGVFDTAPSYGTAEKILGAALATWRGPRPVISTKVGRLPASDGHEIKFDFNPDSMRASLERSLAIFGVPCVDLLFLHEPEYVPREDRARVVDTLRQFQADGLARRLGVAGGYGSGWDGFVESGAFDVGMLFRRVDACIFDGMAEDLPRLRCAEMATYGASPLHMGLLGSRYEEFVRERPKWVWEQPINRAVRLRALAEENNLSLAMLGHRFLFSVAEIDRAVIGARNPAELDDAWAAWKAGPLSEELFAAVCAAQ